MIDFTDNHRAFFSLAIVALMFIMFFKETFSSEVVSILGVSIFLVTGILPYQQALVAFANPAPWTIAAMFVVMGALMRTGVLNEFTNFAERFRRLSIWVYIQHTCRNGYDTYIY